MFQIVSYETLTAESMTDLYSPVTSASTNSHQQSFQSSPLTEVPDIHWKINCNICAKTFTTSTDLRRHAKEQHNPQREVFTCKSSSKSHMALCGSDSRDWKCLTCDKTFIRKYNYDEHLKYAHSQISFRCHCGKGFKWNKSLARHKKKYCAHI